MPKLRWVKVCPSPDGWLRSEAAHLRYVASADHWRSGRAGQTFCERVRRGPSLSGSNALKLSPDPQSGSWDCISAHNVRYFLTTVSPNSDSGYHRNAIVGNLPPRTCEESAPSTPSKTVAYTDRKSTLWIRFPLGSREVKEGSSP